jgi:hypothetical protein
MKTLTASPTVPSSLARWLGDIAPYPARMAWCHTTDGFALRGLIAAGQFTPRHCDVFNEDLLYFFYGRPAFRRSEQDQIGQSARAPVVVIFAPDLIHEGRRIFPFDSGAFGDRYKNWVHRDMTLQDFELSCDEGVPQRHVTAFFKNNSNYLKLTMTPPPKPYIGEYEVESLIAIFQDPSAANADDRRLAMELQVDKPLPLDGSTILALILPDELEEAEWLKTFLHGPGAGIEILKYELTPLRNGGHYQALLEERAVKLQEGRGLV